MIWKLCKIYRVKPNDDFFIHMTLAEKMWFFSMVGQDIKEDFDKELSFADYLASYSNPEAVQQVIEARKQPKPPTDVQFAQMLEKQFGRKVRLPEKGKGQI